MLMVNPIDSSLTSLTTFNFLVLENLFGWRNRCCQFFLCASCLFDIPVNHCEYPMLLCLWNKSILLLLGHPLLLFELFPRNNSMIVITVFCGFLIANETKTIHTIDFHTTEYNLYNSLLFLLPSTLERLRTQLW